MDAANELRQLAELPADERNPIVSLYLDTRWLDEQQRRRVMVYTRDRCREARAARPGLDETLGRLERRVEEVIAGAADTPGLALFASVPRGFWKELAARLPFTPAFSVGPVPLLGPLARLAEARRPVVLGVIGHRELAVHLVELGDVIGEGSLRWTYPQQRSRQDWFHPQGHPRYGFLRRRSRHEAARALTRIADRNPGTRLLLAGPADQLGALRGELPDRLIERMLPDLHVRHEASEAETLRLALEAVRQAGHLEALRRTEAAINVALSGGAAVLGAEDVTLAVQEGRVQALFLDSRASLRGWRCRRCDALGTRLEADCPYCGGDTETQDLGEALIARVLREDGEIHLVDGDARLPHFSGVAASLRPRGAPATLGEVGHTESWVSPAG